MYPSISSMFYTNVIISELNFQNSGLADSPEGISSFQPSLRSVPVPVATFTLGSHNTRKIAPPLPPLARPTINLYAPDKTGHEARTPEPD